MQVLKRPPEPNASPEPRKRSCIDVLPAITYTYQYGISITNGARPRMARRKVVVTNWVHEDVLAAFDESFLVVANQQALSPEELRDQCRDAEAMIAFMS